MLLKNLMDAKAARTADSATVSEDTNPAPPTEKESNYSYSIAFLQSEFQAKLDPNLEATDRRLLLEYENLTQRKLHLNEEEAVRQLLLNSKFYDFKG